MTINISTGPWYDDFDESKNFHQILFKPGVSVQARELTQLQTILKDQIAKFGKHIFKQGSVVIPGNANSNLDMDYFTAAAQYAGADIIPSLWVDKVVQSGNVKGIIKHVIPSTSTDFHTFYIVYTSGGGTTGINSFVENDTVTVVNQGGLNLTVLGNGTTPATGKGSWAYINSGVFFVNGYFVYTPPQATILSKYDKTPSCHVMLQISESIIDSDMDESLLDGANGSPNYAAPGADRLKISLTLTTIPLNATITDDFIELMRFNVGVMEINNRYARYSELEKSLARRTFDESGNYRVSGFNVKIREELKTPWNSGYSVTGSRDKFVAVFSPGKAYINGFETEKIYDTVIPFDKARTIDHVVTRTFNTQASYGQYIYVTDVKTLPDFRKHSLVDLYNSSTTAGATKIGTIRVYGIDYIAGDPATNNAIYKLYFHDLAMDPGYSLTNVGGIQFSGGTMTVCVRYYVPNASVDFTLDNIANTAGSVRAAKVKLYNRAVGDMYVHKYTHTLELPRVGEIITGTMSGAVATIRAMERDVTVGGLPVFRVPGTTIKALKNASNNYDIAYTTWSTFSITTNGSGNGSYTLSGSGTFLAPEFGNTTVFSTAGVLASSFWTSTPNNKTFTITGASPTTTYFVSTQVNKSSLGPKTKSLNTVTLTGVTPANIISLGKADVLDIVSIVTVGGSTPGVDVSTKFRLENGQNDYYYGLGSLVLTGTIPTGTLNITFRYFTHSATGDYFSVDSYAGVTEYAPDYQNQIPSYQSKTTNFTYALRDCIDFRPRMGDDGTFTSGTAGLFDVITNDSFYGTSVQSYVGRIDSVYFDKDANVTVMTGIPAQYPIAPTIPNNVMKLFDITIPPYTKSVDDIRAVRARTDGYTMRDIAKLEDRVASIEEFSTLNATETSLVNFEIQDAITGLNRFKTGYLVDNFDNPLTVCDYFNPFNACQFVKNQMAPAFEYHRADLEIAPSSANYQITGDMITLPYTEVPFIKQETSTRVTNINHYQIVAWEGVMSLTPPSDNWVVTEYLPDVFSTVNNVVNVTQVETVVIWEPATPAPPPPAPNPFVTVQFPATGFGLPADANGDGITDTVSMNNIPAWAVQQSPNGNFNLIPTIEAPVAQQWLQDNFAQGNGSVVGGGNSATGFNGFPA